MVFETEYASDPPAGLLGARPGARTRRCSSRASSPTEAAERLDAAARAPQRRVRGRRDGRAGRSRGGTAPHGHAQLAGRGESVIRPERFARLVTLAGLLIGAARERRTPADAEVLDELNISIDELREDIDVLNVVNFGGGTYVLYAEIVGDEIEVDPDTYGDNFARPARLLPLEAKALVAAIDLFGDHLPQAGLQTAREKIVAALGHDPSEEGLEIAPGARRLHVVRTVNEAIRRQRVLEIHYYKENEDEFIKREVEPYQLVNGPEGWYLGCYDLGRADTRHFRLDRMKEARSPSASSSRREASTSSSPSRSGSPTARSPTAGVARVWVSPERARWLREERTRGRGAGRRRRRRRASLRLDRLAGARDPQGRRRLVVLEPDDAREAVLAEASPIAATEIQAIAEPRAPGARAAIDRRDHAASTCAVGSLSAGELRAIAWPSQLRGTGSGYRCAAAPRESNLPRRSYSCTSTAG